MALHREGLKEEFLVVLLARGMTHQHTPADNIQHDRMQTQTRKPHADTADINVYVMPVRTDMM